MTEVVSALNAIQKRDLAHIWHPCAQMKDYEKFPPVEIASAKGCYITLKNGEKIIDAISSWWCKPLGHGHPRLKKAMIDQVQKFEHVMLPHTTHENLVQLGERLADYTKLDKLLFASDGSCAVEMALKMSVQFRQIKGEKNKQQFVSLANSYHGETVGTLSVSDCGLYKSPYKSLMFHSDAITDIPYVNSMEDPLWQDASGHWARAEKQLEQQKDTLTAIIVEPIVQGAGGMLIYSADFLKHLRRWTAANNVHLIFDEIMTGFYRTGLPLAADHAKLTPDFTCLSKGLTAGWVPMSVTMTSNAIYEAFYDDYETGNAFLHSHTHSGNSLGIAVAVEALTVFEEENIQQKVNALSTEMKLAMDDIANKTGRLKNIRHIGGMIAADLIAEQSEGRLGFRLYQESVKLGALVRPFGNTLYWMPPLNMDGNTLSALKAIVIEAIGRVG